MCLKKKTPPNGFLPASYGEDAMRAIRLPNTEIYITEKVFRSFSRRFGLALLDEEDPRSALLKLVRSATFVRMSEHPGCAIYSTSGWEFQLGIGTTDPSLGNRRVCLFLISFTRSKELLGEELFRELNIAKVEIRLTGHALKQFQLRFPTRPSPKEPVSLLQSQVRKSTFIRMEQDYCALFFDGFWTFILKLEMAVDANNERRFYLVMKTCWNTHIALQASLRKKRMRKLKWLESKEITAH